jgi:hypothetical protein
MGKGYKSKQCGYCTDITTNKIYCSKECAGKGRILDAIFEVIVSGTFPANAGTVRKYLAILKGWKCQICNNTEWLGNPIPLVMDHIDGNSSNWSVEILRFVCGNCDMLLPTYKGRNKGNGRFLRAQRYRDGLSY